MNTHLVGRIICPMQSQGRPRPGNGTSRASYLQFLPATTFECPQSLSLSLQKRWHKTTQSISTHSHSLTAPSRFAIHSRTAHMQVVHRNARKQDTCGLRWAWSLDVVVGTPTGRARIYPKSTQHIAINAQKHCDKRSET